MKVATRNQILEAWDAHDDLDISTERMFAMVRDNTGFDEDIIVNALLYHAERKGRRDERKTTKGLIT